MTLQAMPLRDRLLVRREEESDYTPGGIVRPETAKEKPSRGEVIARGDGRVLENGTVARMVVQVGDRILFGKYSGADVEVEDGGEALVILREDEVLAVLRETGTAEEIE